MQLWGPLHVGREALGRGAARGVPDQPRCDRPRHHRACPYSAVSVLLIPVLLVPTLPSYRSCYDLCVSLAGPEHVAAMWATFGRGCTFVPLSRSHSFPAIERTLTDTQAAALVGETRGYTIPIPILSLTTLCTTVPESPDPPHPTAYQPHSRLTPPRFTCISCGPTPPHLTHPTSPPAQSTRPTPPHLTPTTLHLISTPTSPHSGRGPRLLPPREPHLRPGPRIHRRPSPGPLRHRHSGKR